MAKQAKKIVVIGLDGVEPQLLEKHVKEGILPNIGRFISEGTWMDDTLCPYPSITPPNWATIATGAWPGTHGITDFHENNINDIRADHAGQNWSSERFQVETMWEAADKIGKKSIVLSFPGAWPSKMEHGVVVASQGFTVGDAARDGFTHLSSLYDLAEDTFISTEYGAHTSRITWNDLEDEWKNCPDSMGNEPQEAYTELLLTGSIRKPAPVFWHILLRDMNGKGYDTVTVSPTKDFNDALFTLHKGEWTKKIVLPFAMEDGTVCRCMFRSKCLELSPDGDEFRLYISTPINMDTDWASKPGVSELLFKGESCMNIVGSAKTLLDGALDKFTWCEVIEEHSRWMTEAVTELLTNLEWDLFFMHSHPFDWMYHGLMNDLFCGDPKREADAWEVHRRVAIAEDGLVGAILNLAGKDALCALVSDHGSMPDGPMVNPANVLSDAGLLKMRDMTPEEIEEVRNMPYGSLLLLGGTSIIDYENSLAAPRGTMAININLKDRCANGTVETKDYEKIQQKIIDALLAYKHPDSDLRPVSLALTKRDARLIGLYGDRVGDVVYAVNPEFGTQHGHLLPTAKIGDASINSTFALLGPGIKKGHKISKPVQLVSLIPTLCYASGFPYPDGAEGAVVYDALVNPNFYVAERDKLLHQLDSMEKAMTRNTKPVWEKHDCA